MDTARDGEYRAPERGTFDGDLAPTRADTHDGVPPEVRLDSVQVVGVRPGSELSNVRENDQVHEDHDEQFGRELCDG